MFDRRFYVGLKTAGFLQAAAQFFFSEKPHALYDPQLRSDHNELLGIVRDQANVILKCHSMIAMGDWAMMHWPGPAPQ